jgi:hypothetical protein
MKLRHTLPLAVCILSASGVFAAYQVHAVPAVGQTVTLSPTVETVTAGTDSTLPTETATDTATPGSSATPSPTASVTGTVSPTATITGTTTVTATPTATVIPTVTPTVSTSPTPSPTKRSAPDQVRHILPALVSPDRPRTAVQRVRDVLVLLNFL